MESKLRLYWQPGCTSCLRTREFLQEHQIEFESINVRSDPHALESLRELGVRTVPVLARGTQFVLAQDLDEVASFVGTKLERQRLDCPTLLARLNSLLVVAERLTRELPASRLHERLPQRERTWLDLAYHIPMIVEGFLAAARGGALTYQHYELTPPQASRDIQSIAAIAAHIRQQLQQWALEHSAKRALADQVLTTYFGNKPLQLVLERTTWHVAQHCRQLDHLVGSSSDRGGPSCLEPQLFAGLPMPAAIWDPEITAG
mgnify:FL=1